LRIPCRVGQDLPDKHGNGEASASAKAHPEMQAMQGEDDALLISAWFLAI
jgi:hypothetical protein